MRDLGFAEVASVHGFRSSFRTWCAEVARCRPEIAEVAPAHAIKDKVDLEKRKALMSEVPIHELTDRFPAGRFKLQHPSTQGATEEIITRATRGFISPISPRTRHNHN
jgi:hypothetical protein